MSRVAVLLSLSLAACYGSAPPRPPRVPLPPIEPGVELVVQSETQTTIENVPRTATSCPAGVGEGDPSCVVTRYTEAAPVTHTTTTAAIGDRPLTYAQFRVLTDPQWDAKLARLDELSHRCERANLPRYAGLGLLAAGLLVGPVIAAKGGGDIGAAITYGGVAAGTASYAIGYFASGGRDCNEAQALVCYLDTRDQMAWTSVDGDDTAAEMKALADRFNASLAPGHASADALHMRR